MRITKIVIKNLRCIEEAKVLPDDYTAIVGPNGVGKSTVLHALNIFFQYIWGSGKRHVVTKDDFNRSKGTSEPIEITVTFSDLSKEAIEDLKDYVRNSELTVTTRVTWDDASSNAVLSQHGVRSVIEAFAPYFEADKAKTKADGLTEIYQQFRQSDFPDLPEGAKTKKAQIDALRDYEEEHPELHTPVESPDQFYGFSKGANRLDAHVQWVYVPAVLEATTESEEGKSNALGLLLKRVIRSRQAMDAEIEALKGKTQSEYAKILSDHGGVLDTLSTSLNKTFLEFAPQANSLAVQWRNDDESNVKLTAPSAEVVTSEQGFDGSPAYFGHGLQRSFLIAILRELAAQTKGEQGTLILGCEEPELYQHPPQARYMSGILQSLAGSDNQIILTTHSPYFVSAEIFESVRVAKRDASSGWTVFHQTSLKAVGELLNITPEDAMQFVLHHAINPGLAEIFFANHIVLVEGPEDEAYIRTYLRLMGVIEEFHRLGGHIVSCGGKDGIPLPLSICNELKIPSFVVFDADQKPDPNAQDPDNIDKNRKLLSLIDQSVDADWPIASPIIGTNFAIWPRNIGTTVRDDVSEDRWSRAAQESNRMFSLSGLGGSNGKKPLFIAESLNMLWADNDGRSSNLQASCEAIMEFVRSQG